MTPARVAPWFLLLLAALALRGTVLLAFRAELERDPDSYRRTAQALLELGVYAPDELASRAAGRPIPGAYRPPLYPLLLAGLGAVSAETSWRTGLAQLALGVMTVALSFVLARRYGLGRWLRLAAGLVAADPLLLSLSAQVMTETLAAFLAIATLLAADCALLAAQQGRTQTQLRTAVGWPLAVGVLAGLAVLCRPTFLPWALALPAILLAAWRQRSVASAFVPGLACLGALVLTLAPWGVRNALALGSPLLTTTHGGYTFYLANNRELFEHQRGDSPLAWNAAAFNDRWQSAREAALGPAPWPQGTELASDRLAYALARQEIAADPPGFLRAMGLRLSRLWGVLPERLEVEETPQRQAMRWAIATWYCGVLPLAALGLALLLYDSRSPPVDRRVGFVRILPLLLLLASFTVLHALYWTNLRMRAPLMPAAAVLAAAGASRLAGRKC